ncbi:carboxypeptidase regulatory-like domain-containing protein [Actinacidiphila oryziradicis]|uniref:carboxypeptidase regulatory-like domain-containing protein n=1 Tax=Actinacidiphila oryziradicis TaxID=2571141 RepID=UPI0023F0BCCC|nr:carboxypeptidase regulatory-like domain-containing protein [Actinacidiphila oryziradicis]MCW2871732.1 Kelch repeat-containing protein [Actinacidiphila oryziradicis]
MAVLGTQLPARAAVPEAVPAESAAPAKAHVALEPSCSTPKKGEAGCFALRRTDIASVKSLASPSLVPNGYGAADLQSAYSLPDDGGAGQTVAIVDAYDDPTAEADLATYRAQYGLPACTTANGCFSKVDQRGGTGYPAADTGWAGEISLDLDMVSAAAPYAHILLVESDAPSFDDLGAAVDQAVALGAKYVSNSYGTSYDSSPGSGEDPADTTYDAHYNHPGVAIVASSGDSDYGVAFPAASPYVTSVGGTSLVHDSGSTRGWSESVWNNNGYGPGSGCSLYEPKPAFQTDTGCGMRTVADVSAVADPATGVAVYQTYGGGGWTVYGGTSAASPIIAGVYAAAGTPVAGTYPNSYPYATAGAGLNDVTTGNNGTCTPAYLCTAGAGYDGPTGLGTPDGLAAFRSGPHGELSGTITDSATGSPVSGATVTVTGGGTTHTNADGAYTLTLPAGTYDITVDAFGYATGSATGVTIADGDTLTRSFALAPVPSQTVSGKVTDGSGHDWPLYAKITVDGVPGGPVWTDPLTGAYSMELPQGHDYTLHADSAYPGYESRTRTITVGDAAQKVNLLVAADPWQATAAGYALKLTGPTEPFDSTSSAPQDWSVVNADGTTGGWTFDDPGSRGNNTGGDGAFAIADSDHYGSGAHQDSQLISPVYDFTGNSSPELAFATDLRGYSGQTAEVDVTTDGGGTWTSAWSSTTTVSGPTKIEVPLTDYAGKAAVQLRFHFTSAFGWWWKLDNVFVGRRDYTPTPGGLVTGMVTDANTSAGLVGATVTNKDQATQSAVTLATPDDPGLGDGFYSLFSSSPGDNGFTAAKPHYTGLDKTVKVVADSAVGANFALDAGQLTMSKTSVDASVGWGGQTTKTVTVKNTGKAAATVKLSEQAGGFTIKSSGGAPLKLVKGDYSPLSSKAGAPGAGSTAKVVPGAAGDAWQTAADLPTALMDNAVAGYDGKVYSAFGYNGSADSKDLYVLDPVAGTWTKLAGAADTREDPAHGFIDGKFYAVGGWGSDTAPDPKLEIYDPGSNSWTTGAPAPKPYAGAGSAVLDGKLYTVGGCGANSCGSTDVSVYDPATDSWAQLAAYPEQIAWSACAGIDGKLYCGGGVTDSGEVKHAYVYDPGTDSWSPIADMPVSVWGSSYTSANGLLLTSSGVSQNSITNQGFAFDPAAGEWTALPNANTGTYRGGGSIGFFKVGGANAPRTPSTKVELLPGYDQGGTADVSWLSESTQQLTVQPGKSSTVTLTLDASVPEVTQPGDFSAQLAFSSDTPYSVPKIPVTLHVAEPSTWGKITGTVLGVTTAGGTAPIAGATVQIDTWATSYTLTTGTDGGYALWLDVRNNPLTVIAAKDGFQPTVATVTIKKKTTVTKNFTLKRK